MNNGAHKIDLDSFLIVGKNERYFHEFYEVKEIF